MALNLKGNQLAEDTETVLTAGEQSFLRRILRNRKFFLIFSYTGIGIAIFLLILYMIFLRNMNGTRFALIILILLLARANLRLYKASTIFQKLGMDKHMKGIASIIGPV